MVPWTRRDLGGFHMLWGDSEVIWWRGYPLSWAQSRELLNTLLERCEGMDGGLGWWRIEERDGGQTVGNVLLQPYDDSEVELGLHIVRSHWKKGIGSEAAMGAVRYGFTTLGVERIMAIVHGANAPSKRILQKMAFRNDGFVMHQGMPHERFVKERPGND